MGKKEVERKDDSIIDKYDFFSDKIPISIQVVKVPHEFVPIYKVTIASISKNTEVILERIRKELINEVNLGMVELTDLKKTGVIEQRFSETIRDMIAKYFPDIDENTTEFLIAYLIQKSLGMGSIEILMDDQNLEEITINSADEPVWVYHRKHGWLKTNIRVQSEDQTKHYATMIGRKVGRQISILEPLMDAHLDSGDRVNATLMPASNAGNTITLRKFATKPWTITDFINAGSISASAAALIWLSVQYEISTLIAGGTASGKTSMLNVVSNFFPPNQRIISIEDTREIKLPQFLHWVPMVTRLPNPEGKGEISMLDLLVNSLRMRPDRIIVGEIRRQNEAEVLFEAIHTGHSVYATVHANSTREVITRLTSPPISIPLSMLPAMQLVIVQYRNRRTGMRKTFEIAEILENGAANVLMALDLKKGTLHKVSSSKSLIHTFETFVGMSKSEVNRTLAEREKILLWMAAHNINDVDKVGEVMANYYTNKDFLMKLVNQNKTLG